MKRLILISLLFVLVAACAHKDKSFMPERLLTEEEMIDAMTDLQIIEAQINYQKTLDKEEGENPVSVEYKDMAQAYYDQFFEHYGITDSIFLQNMRYYTERPETLQRIMDAVVKRLTSEAPPKANR